MVALHLLLVYLCVYSAYIWVIAKFTIKHATLAQVALNWSSYIHVYQKVNLCLHVKAESDSRHCSVNCAEHGSNSTMICVASMSLATHTHTK